MGRQGYNSFDIDEKLKVLIREVYDIKNGHVKAGLDKQAAVDKLGEREFTLGSELCVLLMETEYFTVTTKLYISDMYMRKSDVTRVMNESGAPITDMTVRARIRNDILALQKDVGANVINDIFLHHTDMFEKYHNAITMVMYKLNKGNAVKSEFDSKVFIQLPEGEVARHKITDEEINTFINVIKPYCIADIAHTIQSVDKEVLWYIRHIMDKGAVTEEERQHLNMIQTIL